MQYICNNIYMIVDGPRWPKLNDSVCWMVGTIRRVCFLSVFHIDVHDLNFASFSILVATQEPCRQVCTNRLVL